MERSMSTASSTGRLEVDIITLRGDCHRRRLSGGARRIATTQVAHIACPLIASFQFARHSPTLVAREHNVHANRKVLGSHASHGHLNTS
jgi:hypothetical protein